jgi:curved DNA-binding protein CbpA
LIHSAGNMENAASSTHYDTLGVSENASAADIRQAYKALVLLHHPDKADTAGAASPQASPDLAAAADRRPACATTLFIAIQRAYEALIDESSRVAYDAELRAAASRLAAISIDRTIDLDDMRCCERNGSTWYEVECRCSAVLRVDEAALLDGVDVFSCASCCLYVRVLCVAVDS